MSEPGLSRKAEIDLQKFFNWAGVVLGVFGCLLATLTIIETRALAAQSGSLDKPQIQLGIGGNLADAEHASVYLVIPTSCSADLVLAALPLAIKNSGDAAAENVGAMLGFPLDDGASPALGNGVLDEFMRLNGPPVTDHKRSVSDSKLRYVTHSFSKLLPDMAISFEEIIEAPLPVLIKGLEIPGGGVSDLEVEYSIVSPLIVTWDNARPLVGEIEIAAVRADSIDAALPMVFSKLKNTATQESVSVISRIFRQVVNAPSQDIHVVEFAETDCSAEGFLLHDGHSTVYSAH